MQGGAAREASRTRRHLKEEPIRSRNDFFAIVMAGGRGTRFWPLSRTDRPKQLLKLFGDDTLIEQTIRRISPLIPPSQIFIITGRNLQQPIRKATSGLIPARNVLAEPAARNTSPAIALATAFIRRVSSRAVVAILPSDHLIGDGRGFLRVLDTAYSVAKRERSSLVTFGITPEYPETGYGYIERGEAYGGGSAGRAPVHAVKAFKEKPDRETAEEFCRSGRFSWNSGMFVWSIDAYAKNLAVLDPELLALVDGVSAAPRRSRKEAAAIARLYTKAAATSIDYALLEKAPSVFAVEASIGWNDIGSWLSLEKCLPAGPDEIHHNCKELLAESSRRSLAFAPSKLVALLGVSDLVVVDTADALLICHRDRTQDVKKIVARLEAGGMRRYL